jgi:hypothetical protein
VRFVESANETAVNSRPPVAKCSTSLSKETASSDSGPFKWNANFMQIEWQFKKIQIDAFPPKVFKVATCSFFRFSSAKVCGLRAFRRI